MCAMDLQSSFILGSDFPESSHCLSRYSCALSAKAPAEKWPIMEQSFSSPGMLTLHLTICWRTAGDVPLGREYSVCEVIHMTHYSFSLQLRRVGSSADDNTEDTILSGNSPPGR